MSGGLTVFLAALGLVFVIEGALYALLPGTMRRLMTLALAQPTSRLRITGLSAALAGLLLVWLSN